MPQSQRPSWHSLIRFEATDGQVYYGQPVDENQDVGEDFHSIEPVKAYVVHCRGPLDTQARISKDVKTVKRLLAPIEANSVRTVRALGTNYPQPTPNFKASPIPILFYKPLNTLAGPEAIVNIPAFAKGQNVDYECELAVVLNRACSNITSKEALDYVLGYTVAQDISSRSLCAAGVQWGLGKSFDTWLPIGPVLKNADSLKDGAGLAITTHVNGEIKQKANTSDMLYNVARTIAYLSQGTTLEAGSIIIMGSPAPVEAQEGKARQWLKDGDAVKASIEKIGSLYCTIKEESAPLRAKL